MSLYHAEKLVQELTQLSQFAAVSTNKISTVVEFDLSEARTFSAKLNNNVGFSFTSFWVMSSPINDFKMEVSLNSKNSQLNDAFDVRLNMNPSFPIPIVGARFQWPAQPNVKVKIVFFHQGRFDIGNTDVKMSGAVQVRDGVKFDSDNKLVTDSPTIFMEADENRGLSEIYNNGEKAIYIGTLDKLNHADFKKKCLKINPNQSYPYKNAGGCYAKTESGSTDEILIVNHGVI